MQLQSVYAWAAGLVALGSLTAPAQLSAEKTALTAQQQTWLDTHNAERARMGVAPLRWDTELERDARSWATSLANTRSFEHAPQRGDETDQGENLWMGTKNGYRSEEMVGAWIAEKRDYRSGIFPSVSKTGNWKDVGHYVQLIWHNTNRVGCAAAEGGGDEYLVCRYFPAGNWEGEDPLGDSTKKIAQIQH
jgi:uncharacterized protein YkwD